MADCWRWGNREAACLLPKLWFGRLHDIPRYAGCVHRHVDDPSLYQPQLVSWTAAGHSWDFLDLALPKFDTMPPT